MTAPTLDNWEEGFDTDWIRILHGAHGVDLASLKREVSSIKRRYADRYGFIDYYHAAGYATELERFMDKFIPSLLRRGDYKTAFRLVCHIYRSLGKLDIDDSNGETSILSDACLIYWEEIIKQCSLEDQWVFFDWFKKHQDNYVVDYLQCHINDFFIDNFHEPKMLRQKLAVLDSLITKNAAEEDKYGLSRYDLGQYVSARLQVMSELGLPADEIDALCQKYYQLAAVRQFILERYLEQGEIQKAIELLKEGKKIDRDLPGLAARASEKLMQLYQQTGEEELFHQELDEYIKNFRQDDLEHVQLLKQLYDENEWREKRQALLSTQTMHGVKYEFMIQEGLYEELLDEIRGLLNDQIYNNRAVLVLDAYEETLASKYPEAVRDLYANFVRRDSKCANGRRQYRMLAHYLHKIEKYPQGRDIANQIVSEWRTLYPRRKAMMEELDLAGF